MKSPDNLSRLEVTAQLQEMKARIGRMEQRIDALTDKLTQMTEQTPEQKQAEKAFEDSIIEGGSDL